MKKIFTINLCENFFNVLIKHIFSEYKKEKVPEIKIILPCKKDAIALLNAFKSYSTKNFIILPEIISLENINEENLILNLDKIKIIKPTKKILLLIQFILEWNKKNNDNFSIDLVYNLLSLFDKIQFTQTIDHYQFNGYSKKIEKFINSLTKIWNKITKNLGVIDILKHKSD
ncbi:MAG: recombinase RecB, partial [Wolbachia pipientis]|nr:recombinase RecB [Wolbachia pipientis]